MTPDDKAPTYNTGRVATFRSGQQLPVRVAAGYKTEIFIRSDMERLIERQIHTGAFFKYRAKRMTQETSEAVEITDSVVEGFSKSLARLDAVQDGFVKSAKRASGNVRDAAERLAHGIERVEKAANFDRLERYVVLLERAATAMTILAELEAKGKLDKIANAMR